MALFENVSLFVRFSQIFGFLPYSIKKHPQLNIQFHKFSFAWKSPVTWWFFSSMLLQFSFYVWRAMHSLKFHQEEGVSNSNIPPIFAVFVPMEVLFAVIMTIVSRCMILRHKHLRCATAYVQKAHKAMEMDSLPSQLAIKRHVIKGLIWTIFTVSSELNDCLVQLQMTILYVY